MYIPSIPIRSTLIIRLLACAFFCQYAAADDGPAAAPKFLFDAVPANSEGRIQQDQPGVSATPREGGMDVEVNADSGNYPGFSIVPVRGESWDLSPWGHVQASVTNTGDHRIRVHLRVDNAGPWQDNPWNTESVTFNPGETKFIKVIFGHQHGFRPGYKLDPSAVVRVMFFLDRSNRDRSFRVEDLVAGGPAGEKPPVDPSSVVVRPEGGVILGSGAKLEPAAVFEVKGGMRAQWGDGNKTLILEQAEGASGSLTVKPAMGVWNLGNHHEVIVTLRNTGDTAITPRVRVQSRGGATDTVSPPEPIEPGAESTVTASFVAPTPWVGVANPRQKHSGGKRGTGTPFQSDRTNGVVISLDNVPASVRAEVVSIVAAATPVEIPEWVGTRPPVDGDWTLTFEDNFEGTEIDLNTWNIYTRNFWDRRTHFTRDNTIVADGKLTLRYEQKTGFHNDNPEDDSPVARTNFASGYADTFGKWTQRYGYFEARMKLPAAPGLWPAFWMMPDRGQENGIWYRRQRTEDGGMEFDIMEHLTAWGPYRFNVAMHWDGYAENHRAIGSSNIYVPTDAEGFFTIGMLWTPGEVVYYGNGEEIGRWEHPRVANVQSYMILYMVSGGWANVPLDPSQLPSDFVIDYVRAWQRADLATPEDGPKENDGQPFSQH
ncbi:MAG: glycoside hydrolase family 16 protein [Verrucomicrobia bacterium]|nr:glycoside hydrolase family 16 protein [Verrucomicrobiota bacterium]MCH8528023.1 glycoside hydrolase family 16 protein [Kiritimatiellia bacterium]